MKSILSLPIITALLCTFHVRANQIAEKEFVRQYYPNLEEVLTHVTQGISYECNDCTYGIAKSPKGFYLTINTEEKDQSEMILIWDRASSEFLEFDATEFMSSRRLREIPEEFKWVFNQVDYYDFFLYFGYNDWAEDTRRLLENDAIKTPEDIETLARLHSSLAQSYLHPEIHLNYLSLDQKMGLTGNGYNKTSPLQKQRFKEHSEKSLEYWNELKNKHESYRPLIIDNSQLKLGHEYMHFYMLAKSIRENGLANNFLNKAYYSEAWVQYAKNLLDACEQDGILFTSGDNDTYTVRYVQERLGIRTDIKVINTSMLQAGWYWEMIRDNQQLNTKIKNKEYDFLSEKPVFVDYEALSAPYEQWLTKELKSNDTLSYRVIPRELNLPYNNGSLQLELKTGALTISDLILLDVIVSNPKLKAFTSAPYGMVNLGFYYHLATTGRAFSIVEDKVKAMESFEVMENLENLAFYTTVPYLEALGSNAAAEVSIMSYLVLNISPIFTTRREAILDKMYKYLSPAEVVNTENLALIDAINAFYEVMKPEASVEVRELFHPIAEDVILNTTSFNENLDQDLNNLEFIFSIYAHFRVHEQPEYEIELTEIDRKILKSLKEKVEKLLESPVVQQRAWSLQQVLRLKEALNRVATE